MPAPLSATAARVAIAAATIGALTAASAPAASAAGACANEAVRVQQGATELPNCMAYERVSPADKNGAPPRAGAASVDGSRLLFDMNSALEGSQGFVSSLNVAARPSDGTPDWAVTSLAPPMSKRLPGIVDQALPAATSADLDRVVMSTVYPVSDNDRGGFGGPGYAQSPDLYLREKDGSFTWLVPDPSRVDDALAPVRLLGASSDLERVALTTARAFDPRVTTTDVPNVYIWTRNGTQLATVLPDGSLPTGLVENASGGTRSRQDASADARRIAFVNDDGSGPRVYVRFDADDPATASTREVAVRPDGGACISPVITGLSRDGIKLLFSCSEPDEENGGLRPRYFERDLDGGPGAVRSIGMTGVTGAVLLGATDDYSRAYFSTGTAIYALGSSGPATKVVAPTDVGNASQPFISPSISPDGAYLAFRSARDFGLSGIDTGSDDTEQVYRYEVSTDTLTCVSCRQDGSSTEGEGRFQDGIRGATSAEPMTPVTDNGTVAFSSTTALDRADTNGVQDAYAWIDGRQVLLSTGNGEQPSASAGLSGDGRTVFVTTADSLVRNDRDHGAFDIYAAREGGGFLLPDEPAACTTSCQAPGPERPAPLAPGSAGFFGSSSPVAPSRKATPRATVAMTASRSVRGPKATVRVKVSRAGVVRLSGSGLRTTTVRAGKAGTYRVTVRLSASGRTRQARTGRLTTRATARFTPTAGVAVRAQRAITFTGSKKKGGR